MLPYRDRIPLEQRLRSSRKALDKRPGHCPCILERGSKETPPLDKDKFLLSRNLQVHEFLSHIRQKMPPLRSSQSIFLTVGKAKPVFLTSHELIGRLYDAHKDEEDFFLYLTYSAENAFG